MNHDVNESVHLKTNIKRKQVSCNENTILTEVDIDHANLVTPPTTKTKTLNCQPNW